MGMDTIFDNLKSAGYKTALYGKWHVGYYQNEARPGSRGVDESLHFFRGAVIHDTMCSSKVNHCRHFYEKGDGWAVLNQTGAYGDATRVDIYDIQQTVDGVDSGVGYQYLVDHGLQEASAGGRGVFSDLLYKERAVSLIQHHDFGQAPLLLFLAWAGPHSPHQVYNLTQAGAAVDAARCQQLSDESPGSQEAAECSGDYFYRTCAWIKAGQFYQACAAHPQDCLWARCNQTAYDNYGHTRSYASRHGGHRLYDTQTHELDGWIGEVHQAIRDRGVWNTTITVLQSDNGGGSPWMMNQPLRGGKFTLWEGGIRVRAAIGGGAIPLSLRGRETEAVLHQIDWMPTLSFAAGYDHTIFRGGAGPPDGVSMWAVLKELDVTHMAERIIYASGICSGSNNHCSDVSPYLDRKSVV